MRVSTCCLGFAMWGAIFSCAGALGGIYTGPMKVEECSGVCCYYGGSCSSTPGSFFAVNITFSPFGATLNSMCYIDDSSTPYTLLSSTSKSLH
jgi:hypothetical protein